MISTICHHFVAIAPGHLLESFIKGPRACIGRKFATTEAVCFLTMLLRDWKVEPLLNAGETVDQWKDRVLQASLIFTLSIRDVPVRFVRRTGR